MLFSIIVPVYNVIQYLTRCILSIEKQETQYSYEIIVVDDGSTDGSSDLCDQIAKQYENIVVIHKSNGGLSDARNTGIKRSIGEYILFLDSDDYMVENAINNIGSYIEKYKPDLLYADVIVEKKGKLIQKLKKTGIEENKEYDGSSAMLAELQSGKYQAMVPMGVYRKDYLLDNGFWFKIGILHEDEEWSPRVFSNAGRVVYVSVPIYVYCLREGSITSKSDKTKNALDLIETCYSLEYAFSFNSNNALRKHVNGYLARLYMAAVSECIIRGDIKELKKFDRRYVWGKWTNIKDFLKIMVFSTSPFLYAHLLERVRLKNDYL